jgi:hypothetical protein
MILTKLDSDSSFDLTAEKLIEYQKIDMDLNFLISWKEKGEKPVWTMSTPIFYILPLFKPRKSFPDFGKSLLNS